MLKLYLKQHEDIFKKYHYFTFGYYVNLAYRFAF